MNNVLPRAELGRDESKERARGRGGEEAVMEGSEDGVGGLANQR